MAWYFNENELLIRLLTAPNNGFRPGQLGALHSVLSHFSVYDEPATLCLPTGYGKTAVMMGLPFFIRARRVLVVEPSDALRKQTTGHFKDLSTLRKIGVIAEETPNPLVIGQKGRPTSKEEWESLKAHDVVVSTPQSTSPKLTPDPPSDLFDLIIFDEAHHAPADTWAAYLEVFSTARFVFLTATPFRRDKKPIPGRLSYYYPVKKASREKAFGKVKFKSAPVLNDQDRDEIDRSVAVTAVEQLKKDREYGYDHRIFARTESIKAARDLVDIYIAAGAKVAPIASHISKKHQDKIERSLISGELDGVVCVDMFGEGYDFPKLKIAALHAPHRSLVPTLQFIGRFARTTDASTGDATLVAPVSRLKDALVKLFQEGIDIAELIDGVAQDQIADTEADREILNILKLQKQASSDYDAVSPLLLKLYAHTMIFECAERPDFKLFKGTIGRNLLVVKHWMDEEGLITLLLTVDNSPPNWATSDVLVNIRHDAFLLAYNETTKLSFIGSTRRTSRLYLDLMQTVCKDQYRQLSYEMTRRAIAGLSNLRFYNVGLKNTAINTQAESYRVLTGPHAERAVTAGDARSFVQGHFYGSGVVGEERETIGASSSSRIWGNKSLTVAEYIEWISILNTRLNGKEEVAPSQLDIIQHAKVLRKIPVNIIAAGWNKVAYRYAPKVRNREKDGDQWNYQRITDFEILGCSVAHDQMELAFNIGTDTFSELFSFTIKGGAIIRQTGTKWILEVQSGIDDWEDLATWLSMHPPVFYAADKSSFQGVNLMNPRLLTIAKLSEGDTLVMDWDDCETQVECDFEKTNGKLTVHQYLEKHLRSSMGLKCLVYDHRSGEAADFVAIQKEMDASVCISLYHCKGAGGDPSGGRVNDVYDVAGQLLKSIAYCEASILLDHITYRANASYHKNPSQFIVGNLEELKQILEDTPANKLKFVIYAVQPGIAKAKIDDHLADLMAFGLEYVQRGGAAQAAWIISP